MIVKSPILISSLKKHKRWNQIIASCFSSFSHNLKSHPNDDVLSTNISMSGHCKSGRLEIAQKLFDEMPRRTAVSWNTMICGYSKWGRCSEAMSVVSSMHKSNTKLNETTFSKTLSACARSRSYDQGKEVHCLVLKSGSESFELVGCSLLFFYANLSKIFEAERVFEELRGGNDSLWSVMVVGLVQCNLLTNALNVFVKMPKRDIVAWTSMISGYAKSEHEYEKALELFKWMKSDLVIPNEFTLDCVIRVLGRLRLLSQGMSVHGLVIKFGFESEGSVSNALIEFYCGCESISCAKRVFEGIVNPCPSASGSLISGLISLGKIEEAEMIFNGLRERDLVCCNLMIKGYLMSGQINESKRLFEKMTQKSIVSMNTMISVYSKNGEIEKALSLFDETKDERDHVTWNSMISGYAQNNLHDEALKLYSTMRRSSIDCTRSTFCVALHSCSCLGSLQLGKSLHAHLTKTSYESNVYIGTALTDMYSKCGSIDEARKSFDSISLPNVASFTALINGYALHGLGSLALSQFDRMSKLGIAPNAATFVAILRACRFSGLTEKGSRLFRSMKSDYGVSPSLEHYACVVDLLGRLGLLREAFDFVEEMPVKADSVIWCSLLNACWFWMDLRLGEEVAERVLSFEPKPVYGYVILSNIYAVMGMWRERLKLRKRLEGLEAKKDPGCSWIELKSKVHVFYVEDNKSDQCCNGVLESLSENINSLVQLDSVSLSKIREFFCAD